MRSRELDVTPNFDLPLDELLERLGRPGANRYDELLEALRRGASVEALHERTAIDPWFLREFAAIAHDEAAAFAGVRTYKSVDTCAAEFAASTPYYYSGWERPSAGGGATHEVAPSDRPSVVILGSGPNRIGQGIEFDYCCVHAAMTFGERGREAVMINCNPETVSTDYDTSDRLYFEPLTLEDVLGVIEDRAARGRDRPVRRPDPAAARSRPRRAGVRLLGTSVDAIDAAEDRGRFGDLLQRLGCQAAPYATASTPAEALAKGEEVGYPLLVRPSYVLGGRAMQIVYSTRISPSTSRARRDRQPTAVDIYLDHFLENAIEVDVDALCDGERDWIGGIMQHVEEAGIHSGDSACVLPPHSLGPACSRGFASRPRRSR